MKYYQKISLNTIQMTMQIKKLFINPKGPYFGGFSRSYLPTNSYLCLLNEFYLSESFYRILA
jgi:hypothetical protein